MELAERVGLEDRVDHRPMQLSGGQPAARVHRPRDGERAIDPAGRRTDRRARQQDRSADPGTVRRIWSRRARRSCW